jgi:hypothetical protein
LGSAISVSRKLPARVTPFRPRCRRICDARGCHLALHAGGEAALRLPTADPGSRRKIPPRRDRKSGVGPVSQPERTGAFVGRCLGVLGVPAACTTSRNPRALQGRATEEEADETGWRCHPDPPAVGGMPLIAFVPHRRLMHTPLNPHVMAPFRSE